MIKNERARQKNPRPPHQRRPGISRPGSDPAARLRRFADAWIVCPDRERSANSLSLTLRRPLRIQKVRQHVYAVTALPPTASTSLEKAPAPRPQLILSGMEPWLQSRDAGHFLLGHRRWAIQGTFLDIPSAAVSLMPGPCRALQFRHGGAFVAGTAKVLAPEKLPSGITPIIHPSGSDQRDQDRQLGQKRYNPEIIARKTPGESFITGSDRAIRRPPADDGTDVRAVLRGYITITPLA